MGNMVKEKFSVDYSGYKEALAYIKEQGENPFDTQEEFDNKYNLCLGSYIVDFANALYRASNT